MSVYPQRRCGNTFSVLRLFCLVPCFVFFKALPEKKSGFPFAQSALKYDSLKQNACGRATVVLLTRCVLSVRGGGGRNDRRSGGILDIFVG